MKAAVLVVEDEAIIRMSIVEELEDAGFLVFQASNAAEAIDVLITNRNIEVMFTDIGMPGGVDGLKLAASVRDRWPPVKIIVTSGHRGGTIGALPVECQFMLKPYDPVSVIETIQVITN